MRRIMLCLPEGALELDPAPRETMRRDVELVFSWDGTPTGVVGWAEGGVTALTLAAEHPDLVDRLVLVSTPVPEPPTVDMTTVGARTLLLYGARDGGNARAVWWKDRLGGRIEMVPGEGADILERVWPRVLSHLAPGTLRT